MVILDTSVSTTPDEGLNLAQMGSNKLPEAIGSTVTPDAGVALDVPTHTAMLDRITRISTITNNLRLNILEAPLLNIDITDSYWFGSFV
jgi:hypothetical protein